MKDFYKILGVKENASEEEIRERWIELTKHYHPDRGEGMASDEKIKEINEAYQVMKHSSTRVEYDLKRTYGHKKRGSRIQRLAVPASILLILVFIGLLSLRSSQNQTNQKNLSHLSRLPRENGFDSFHWGKEAVRGEIPLGSLSHRDQTNPTNSTNVTIQRNSAAPTTQKPAIASTPQHPITQSHRGSMTQLPNDSITQSPNDPITSRPTAATNQTNQTNERGQINPVDAELQLAQLKPPPLVATEDEVRKFFGYYVERYTRKDIEGFLSLFSSKAVQNQKEGLEGIRKVYSDFFNQSQGLGYRMEEMKIEIYENAVEVKAYYELEQLLGEGGKKRIWKGNIRWVLIREDGALKILSLNYRHQKNP